MVPPRHDGSDAVAAFAAAGDAIAKVASGSYAKLARFMTPGAQTRSLGEAPPAGAVPLSTKLRGHVDTILKAAKQGIRDGLEGDGRAYALVAANPAGQRFSRQNPYAALGIRARIDAHTSFAAALVLGDATSPAPVCSPLEHAGMTANVSALADHVRNAVSRISTALLDGIRAEAAKVTQDVASVSRFFEDKVRTVALGAGSIGKAASASLHVQAGLRFAAMASVAAVVAVPSFDPTLAVNRSAISAAHGVHSRTHDAGVATVTRHVGRWAHAKATSLAASDQMKDKIRHVLAPEAAARHTRIEGIEAAWSQIGEKLGVATHNSPALQAAASSSTAHATAAYKGSVSQPRTVRIADNNAADGIEPGAFGGKF